MEDRVVDLSTVADKRTLRRAILKRVPGAFCVTLTPFLDAWGVGVCCAVPGMHEGLGIATKAPLGITYSELLNIIDEVAERAKKAIANPTSFNMGLYA